MKVTIIGGGIVGLCTAYYLKNAGYEVTVIDRNDITDGCSFGNMGYISPSHFIPIASPGIVAQGLKWMLSSTSPFYIRPRLNTDLIRWMWAFRRSSSKQKMEENIPHLNNLLQLSRELMNDLKQVLHGKFTMVEKGCWMLYKKEKTGEHEKQLAEQAAHLGLKALICTNKEVQQYETETEVDVAGGVLYLDDCHIDTPAFMRAMYLHLQGTGVRFWINTEVTGFTIVNDRITGIQTKDAELPCDELIIANGSWLGLLSKQLGLNLLMQPGKGYSMVYNDLQANLQFPSILVDDRTATTPLGNSLRIGGTMEMSGHDDRILPRRVMAIHAAFGKYYPSMKLSSPDTTKAWYGYRPVTPDGLPYIGRHDRYANLSFAGGHAMLGVSAAAGTGKLIEQVLSGAATSIPLTAFRPGRFD